MKKELVLLLILVVLLGGCKTTGLYATDACDYSCKNERNIYSEKVNSLVAEAKQLAVKIEDWKNIASSDVEKMKDLQTQFNSLGIPYNYEIVHTYYGKGLGSYVESMEFAYKASEAYMMGVDVKDIQTSNMARSQAISFVSSAYNSKVRAGEEVKFALGLATQINSEN